MTGDTMPSGVHETLWHFFKDGPIGDGDLVSKGARTWLVDAGLADRAEGFNFLTAAGVAMAVSLDMHRRKAKERRTPTTKGGHDMTDADTIATLQAQLDSTLKDRALILAKNEEHSAARDRQFNLICAFKARAEAAEARADAAVTVKPHEIERLVFAAMVWGASQPQRKNGAAFPNYHDRGNSNAETEARAIAARIRAAIGGAA